ncbi:LamG domain-containing protein [Alishewanella tabrizica]|uniref:DUF6701 domain-containing protein n=1 Tax=Alishewanella tabrizica TaxID=671278 RepID=A0ABQ2WCG5_9ALTE|nr:LamG domain-containing protein [Alishewanella tabrizica]GGW48578.1 hypothetical protein GCM10008111_00280 [Alishewanella tabrizica]
MKFFLLIVFSLFLCVDALAATYAFRSTNYEWESANTDVIWDRTQTGFPADDDKQVVNLGFTFNFGGVNYTQVRILANGSLQFGADTQFHRQFNNTNLPVNTLPPSCTNCTAGTQADRLILVYWDDINPALGGTVRYQTKGTGPNRRFVVSWENVPHFSLPGQYSFQVILFENGEFVFQYGTGNASGFSATIGVEVNNSDFTLYAFNNSFSYAGTAIRWFKPSGDPIRLADYWLEEQSWSGRPNEVVDWTGNGYAGNMLGVVQSVANGRVCRAANVPLNTNTTVSGINTNIDVDSAIGNRGSITFWYRGNTTWTTRDNQLFDATSVGNAWFHLTKRINGSLQFRVSDTQGTTVAAETGNYNFAANTWKHIAVSWRFAPGNNQTILRIYLDGVLVQSQQRTTNGQLPASLTTLFLGDNPNNISQLGASTINSADGYFDEIKVYNYEISSSDVIADRDSTHACVNIDHLRIEHDGEGLTCDAESVVIKACINADCTALFPGYVPVDFLLNTSLNGSSLLTAGLGSYTFNRGISGNVSLAATTSFSTTTASRCFIGAAENCVMQFSDVGIIFNNPQNGSNLLDNGHAGVSYNAKIRVVRTNPQTMACEARLTEPRTVQFGVECLNPGSCVSDQQFLINNININKNNAGASGSRTPINLAFDTQGSADFTYQYTDVGSVRLHASLALPEEQAGPAVTLNGTSNNVIMRPHTLQWLEASSLPYQANANPGSTNSGAGFWPAGRPFRLIGEARNAQGQVTPNFGNETPSQRLTAEFAQLVYPATGVGNAGLFTAGSFEPVSNAAQFPGRQGSSGAIWQEAGTIRLRMGLLNNSYLGTGDALNKPLSGNIGRFYPAELALSTATVQDACNNSFTYMAQPGIQVSYDLLARGDAVSGSRTLQNYDSALYTGTAQFSVVAKNTLTGNESINLGNRLAVTTANWVAGRYQIAQNDVRFNRQVNQQPDGPFAALQLGLQIASEIDNRPLANPNFNANLTGSCVGNCNAVTLGDPLHLRYGRAVLDNAFGPEFDRLPLTLRAEYWNGSLFAENTLDNCTLVEPSNLVKLTGTITPAISGSGATMQAGKSSPLSLLLAAPGTTAQLTYQYIAPPWLTYSWDGSADYTQQPQNEVIFGRYRGNPRLIFWREQ